jgi:hypothetical protein
MKNKTMIEMRKDNEIMEMFSATWFLKSQGIEDATLVHHLSREEQFICDFYIPELSTCLEVKTVDFYRYKNWPTDFLFSITSGAIKIVEEGNSFLILICFPTEKKALFFDATELVKNMDKGKIRPTEFYVDISSEPLFLIPYGDEMVELWRERKKVNIY